MLSYHLRPPDPATPNAYFEGFRCANVDDPVRLGVCATSYVWSPIVWRDGRRKQTHFVAANWCVLDFDDGELTLAEAERLFCDVVHFIGTTKSHQVPKGGVTCDRFRVALQWEETVTDPRVYKWNMHKIMERYPCDKACKDAARFFYPCTKITSVLAEGYHAELDREVPPDFDVPRDFFKAYRRSGVLPPWAGSALETVWPEHTRNTTIYRIAKDLTKVGIDPDEIEARVVSSPTYNGRVSRELLREIRKAVDSGARKASTEQVNAGGQSDRRAAAGETQGGEPDRQAGEAPPGGGASSTR